MGGGLVEAAEVGVVPEFLDESVELVEPFELELFELLELFLFLRAHGGRSVCGGGVGIGPD
jgi:hypothetical protein